MNLFPIDYWMLKFDSYTLGGTCYVLCAMCCVLCALSYHYNIIAIVHWREIAVSSHCNAQLRPACGHWLDSNPQRREQPPFLSPFSSFPFNSYLIYHWYHISISYLEEQPFFAISETNIKLDEEKMQPNQNEKYFLLNAFFMSSYSVWTWNKVVLRQSLGLRA